jgi:hypothetical protein
MHTSARNNDCHPEHPRVFPYSRDLQDDTRLDLAKILELGFPFILYPLSFILSWATVCNATALKSLWHRPLTSEQTTHAPVMRLAGA